MFDIELPEELRAAINEQVVPSRKLAAASVELSNRYRSGAGTQLQYPEDAAAYAAFRMPATYAAVYSALRQTQDLLAGWSPRTLLDVGAGPGTSMWAATSIWPDLEHITLLERDEGMIELGKKMAARSSFDPIRDADWKKADVTTDWNVAPQDLVIMAYVLGELPHNRGAVLKKLWDATAGTLVIVEPGTPAGFARVRKAREGLLAHGATTIAPCPHDDPCPMGEKDWCHFAQRVARSRIHRQVKAGDLGYEDEKFSFVSVSRMTGRKVPGRVVRHPQVRPGHIRFEVCTPDGLDRAVVTRKDKELFRKARDTDWGSVMPSK